MVDLTGLAQVLVDCFTAELLFSSNMITISLLMSPRDDNYVNIALLCSIVTVVCLQTKVCNWVKQPPRSFTVLNSIQVKGKITKLPATYIGDGNRGQGGHVPPQLSEKGGHRGALSLHALSNSNLPHIALVGS